MKKSLLILSALSLLAYQAFGQASISVTGANVSSPTGAAGTTFDSQMTLTITGANSIGDVSSVNMLLRTQAGGGGLSGAGLFSVVVQSTTPPFSLANNPASSTFNTAGDAMNPGTVSDPTLDRGDNAPFASAPAVAATGTTTIPFEVLRFTALVNLAPGVYNFFCTAGGLQDAQGSWIDNSSNATFDVNSEPLFTITIVPEPATLSLLALGGLGSLGLILIRARRKS